MRRSNPSFPSHALVISWLWVPTIPAVQHTSTFRTPDTGVVRISEEEATVGSLQHGIAFGQVRIKHASRNGVRSI